MRSEDAHAGLSPCWSHKSFVVRWLKHYENMPVQIYWEFYHQKNENFQMKNSDIFLISAQNIDCGYSLEPPQSMFLSRKKNILYKSGVYGNQNYIGLLSWCIYFGVPPLFGVYFSFSVNIS